MKRRAFICFIEIFFPIILLCMASGCSVAAWKSDEGMHEDGKEALFRNNGENLTIEKSEDLSAVWTIFDTVVDVFKEPDIRSEIVTQAIYNQQVEVIEEKDEWAKIKMDDGRTGWIKSKYAVKDLAGADSGRCKFKAIVISKSARVYSQYWGGTTLKEVVMGTEFYILNEKNDYYEVMLPLGITGWIEESATIKNQSLSNIPASSAEDFAATAKKFKGTRYQQGGISSRGIDCAGLIYISGKVNGVKLPRSLEEQFRQGTEIPLGRVKIGDLIFLSSKEGSEDIADAGIYVEDNCFIHANKQKGYVTVDNIDNENFSKRIIGVRRVFTERNK